MLGLWPGGKELLCKKHRPGWPSSWRLRPAPAGWGGLNGRPAGRSYNGIILSLGKERLARPAHKIQAASWFLHRRSLPPGLAPGGRPPFGVVPISIRFERFTVFHTSGRAGGHDWDPFLSPPTVHHSLGLFPCILNTCSTRVLLSNLPKLPGAYRKSLRWSYNF